MVECDIKAGIQLHYQGDLAIMATKMLDVSISFIGHIISAIGNSENSLVERVIPLHLSCLTCHQLW